MSNSSNRYRCNSSRHNAHPIINPMLQQTQARDAQLAAALALAATELAVLAQQTQIPTQAFPRSSSNSRRSRAASDSIRFPHPKAVSSAIWCHRNANKCSNVCADVWKTIGDARPIVCHAMNKRLAQCAKHRITRQALCKNAFSRAKISEPPRRRKRNPLRPRLQCCPVICKAVYMW